jgi:hypothetical protein
LNAGGGWLMPGIHLIIHPAFVVDTVDGKNFYLARVNKWSDSCPLTENARIRGSLPPLLESVIGKTRNYHKLPGAYPYLRRDYTGGEMSFHKIRYYS